MKLERFRLLVANPTFLTIAVATFVVGGANAALLSLINAYAKPERLASALQAALTLAQVLFALCPGLPAIRWHI